MKKQSVLKQIKNALAELQKEDMETQIDTLNAIRKEIAQISPFTEHPVDFLQWIPANDVVANDYNPNKVAPPEMQLLYVSIREDGYTQPIVAYYDKELKKYIVVDGFHRNRVGKEYEDINKKIHGYLPIVVINKDINSRMASTVRHNRARGTHQVQSMAELVAELYLKGWSDKKISEQLGMEKDEVLKLKQFTGLGSLFALRKFSKSWIARTDDKIEKAKELKSKN